MKFVFLLFKQLIIALMLLFSINAASQCNDPTACNFGAVVACEYSPNDLCINAIPLSEGTNIIDNSVSCVTEGYTIPDTGCNITTGWCGGNAGVEVDVFYSFTTPPNASTISIETSFDGTGTLTDTQIAIFAGCGGTLIAANDDGGTDQYMSKLIFDCGDLAEGTTYLVLIDGYAGDQGTANLELIFDTTCFIFGCVDNTACNYNSLANQDDGSCIMPDGCTNPAACNYDSTAVCDDGSCSSVPGCITSTACNYDPLATCNDGSCILPNGCANLIACNYNSLATCDDGSCIMPGCNDPAACNYDAAASCFDVNTCEYSPTNDLCSGAIALNSGLNVINNSISCQDEGYIIPADGCNTTTGWCNSGIEADVFYSFTTPSHPSTITLETLFDGTGTLTDTQMAVFSDCGGVLVAANDDGSADQFMSRLFFDCGVLAEGTTYLVLIDGYNGAQGTANLELTLDHSTCPIPGCMDVTACNYYSIANQDDGSCILPDGCTNAIACNYDNSALCDNGSCILPDGCTDAAACNYDASANCDDGSCIMPDGCTNAAACNYEATALCDDGSCNLPDG